MSNRLVIVVLLLVLTSTSSLSKFHKFRSGMKFQVFKNNCSAVWKREEIFEGICGCERNDKISFVVHGFLGSSDSWIFALKDKFLKYRGGCVVTLQWGKFSDNLNYFQVVDDLWNVTEVLKIQLQQMEMENFDLSKFLLYGHSLGGRMVIEASLRLGGAKIGFIDACDLAGPLFNIYDLTHDPKLAAKNVQCIHTSIDFGTSTRNCHQDFVMGECGVNQPASDPLYLTLDFINEIISRSSQEKNENIEDEVKINHNLCNDFYINSFENDFRAINENINNCENIIDISTLPKHFKMGCMESRRNSSIKGIIPCPTSPFYPYNLEYPNEN